MDSFTEKMRKDEKLRESFFQCVVNPSETVRKKADAYIYYTTIITPKGIEFFPIIGRPKTSTPSDYFSINDYEIFAGSSEKNIARKYRSYVPVVDYQSGIMCVGVSNTTLARIQRAYKTMMAEAMDLVKEELKAQNIQGKKETLDAIKDCLNDLNYMHEIEYDRNPSDLDDHFNTIMDKPPKERLFDRFSNWLGDTDCGIDYDYDLGDRDEDGIPNDYDRD